MRKTPQVFVLQRLPVLILRFPDPDEAEFHNSGHSSRDLHASSIPPKAFEIIELSGFSVEKVNNEIAVIQQDPLRAAISLDADRTASKLFLELLAYLVSDGLHLSL